MHRIYHIILALSLSYFLACKNSDHNDNEVQPDSEACGVIGLLPKVVNGTSCARPELSPVVRILILDQQGDVANCTGTMITAKQVITAAHCFQGVRAAKVVIGGDVENGRQIDAVGVTVHPDYIQPDNDENINDLAILELESASNLPTIPILIGKNLEEGEIVSIFGYGVDDSGEVSETLRSGEMKISSTDDNFFHAEFKGTGSNACFGDSGGPLLTTHLGRTVLAGTTAFGTRDDCKPGDTTAFIRLQNANALNFITLVAPQANFQ